MKRRMFRIILISLILIIVFFGGLYILGMKSDAYKFAINFIDGNTTVVSTIGAIKSRRLAFWRGYVLRSSGPHGYAEYKITVIGERASGTVYLILEETGGNWEIKRGTLILESSASIPLF